eukprot:gene23548-9072_t
MNTDMNVVNSSLTDAGNEILKFENWREESWAMDGREEDSEKTDSTNTSSTEEEASGEADAANESGLISHKVASTPWNERGLPIFESLRISNFDTLAGLAIRYNVPISDIKRANGIISDNSMYAHQILHPATAAAARAARALNLVDQVSSSGRGDADDELWQLGGLCGGGDGGVFGESSGGLSRQKTWSGDIGLNNDRCYQYLPPSTYGASRQMSSDLSLRKRGSVGSIAQSQPEEPGFRARLMTSLSAKSRPSGEGFFANLSKSIADSAFVQKIKHAASQPALSVDERAHSMVSPAWGAPRTPQRVSSSGVPVSYHASSHGPLQKVKESAKDERSKRVPRMNRTAPTTPYTWPRKKIKHAASQPALSADEQAHSMVCPAWGAPGTPQRVSSSGVPVSYHASSHGPLQKVKESANIDWKTVLAVSVSGYVT